MAETGWQRIKQILDGAIERWEKEHGRKPALKVTHEGALNWETKEHLAASHPFDLQLIEPDKVGNGRARDTNFVRILTRNIGGYRRMPSQGPYLPTEEIEEIVQWIDSGMPD